MTALFLERSSRSGDERVSSPSWTDVKRIIESLDGVSNFAAFVGDDETQGLYVTGGPDRFVMWVQRWDSGGTDLLIDTARGPSDHGETVRIKLSNGQIDEFPMAATVDRFAVLRAARVFLRSGGMDSSIEWEHQGP